MRGTVGRVHESLSLRRAWIEIRPAAGTRGCWTSRSPYGERGLKFADEGGRGHHHGSLSLRRAWIEICGHERTTWILAVALLTESVD